MYNKIELFLLFVFVFMTETKSDIKFKSNSKSKLYLVFDLETTGFPEKAGGKWGKFYHPSQTDKYDSSRIVEIAYVLFDHQFNKITTFQTIIKPDYPIDERYAEASKIHGINIEKSNKGADMKEVLDRIKTDFNKADVIVAHNIDFDYSILLSESYRYDNNDMIDILNEFSSNKIAFCTMRKFVDYKKSLNPTSKEYIKFPKLIEMYYYFFGNEFQGAHSALYDCQACALCFREIIKKIDV